MFLSSIDLLYLDTLEWGRTPGDEVDCWMNQVAELASVWWRLPSGCLIASDDNQEPERGKPVLTRKLFESLGIKPVFDQYIVIWRKPLSSGQVCLTVTGLLRKLFHKSARYRNQLSFPIIFDANFKYEAPHREYPYPSHHARATNADTVNRMFLISPQEERNGEPGLTVEQSKNLLAKWELIFKLRPTAQNLLSLACIYYTLGVAKKACWGPMKSSIA